MFSKLLTTNRLIKNTHIQYIEKILVFCLSLLDPIFSYCNPHQTKHLCNLVSAPLWCLIYNNFCSDAENKHFGGHLGQICIKFSANVALYLVQI